jgi:hypothetical protein
MSGDLRFALSGETKRKQVGQYGFKTDRPPCAKLLVYRDPILRFKKQDLFHEPNDGGSFSELGEKFHLK